MAYKTRSLNELGASVRGLFRQYLPGTDATLRQNFVAVCAKVLALMAREFELRFDWVYRQLFLTTATDLSIVRLHAAEFQVFQKPAAPASGGITGTGRPSTTYPAGVRFGSNGSYYVTRAPFTTDALGEFTAGVVAETAGAATNRDWGAVLNLVDAALYPDIRSTAVVGQAGLGGGADRESLESLRKRALLRKATPPQGGSLLDYERMARDVPGVTKAWARQFEGGLGTIGVWTLFDGRPLGIPTQADLDAVDAAINARRLIRGKFMAIAPSPTPVAISVALDPDTVATRAATSEALRRFFDPVEGKVRPGLPNEPFILTTAWISEVISGSEGELNHALVQPQGSLTFGAGQLPVLGPITWL